MRNPLLSVRLVTLTTAVALIPVTLKSQESVADAARKNRSKDQTPANRVWTNDDIASANSTEPDTSKKETKENVSATLQIEADGIEQARAETDPSLAPYKQ
jgi:hypothetical protein